MDFNCDFKSITHSFFLGKVIEHEMCFGFLSETLLILRIRRDIIINVKMSSCEVKIIFVKF
jgi:hypothetical protein